MLAHSLRALDKPFPRPLRKFGTIRAQKKRVIDECCTKSKANLLFFETGLTGFSKFGLVELNCKKHNRKLNTKKIIVVRLN